MGTMMVGNHIKGKITSNGTRLSLRLRLMPSSKSQTVINIVTVKMTVTCMDRFSSIRNGPHSRSLSHRWEKDENLVSSPSLVADNATNFLPVDEYVDPYCRANKNNIEDNMPTVERVQFSSVSRLIVVSLVCM